MGKFFKIERSAPNKDRGGVTFRLTSVPEDWTLPTTLTQQGPCTRRMKVFKNRTTVTLVKINERYYFLKQGDSLTKKFFNLEPRSPVPE